MPGTYAEAAVVNSSAQKEISTLGGVIDSDYRGNITGIMTNQSSTPMYIEHNTRFAQLIMKRIWILSFQIANTLTPTKREASSFFISLPLRLENSQPPLLQ